MGSITFYDDIKRTRVKDGNPKYTILNSQSLNNKVSGGIPMEYINKGEFEQFDKRITDKLNDIRIDTDKIKNIDKTVYEMKKDLSSIRVATTTVESDFSTMKSDVSILKTTISNIDESVETGIKTQKMDFETYKNDINREIINIQSSTAKWAFGILVTIGIGFIGTIITLITQL